MSRCVLNSLYEPIQGSREAVAVLTACAFAVCSWRECLLRAGHRVIAAGDARTDSRKRAAARSNGSLGGPRGRRRGACTSLDCLSCSTPFSWISSLSFPDTCTNSGAVLTPGMSPLPLSAASVANQARHCAAAAANGFVDANDVHAAVFFNQRLRKSHTSLSRSDTRFTFSSQWLQQNPGWTSPTRPGLPSSIEALPLAERLSRRVEFAVLGSPASTDSELSLGPARRPRRHSSAHSQVK